MSNTVEKYVFRDLSSGESENIEEVRSIAFQEGYEKAKRDLEEECERKVCESRERHKKENENKENLASLIGCKISDACREIDKAMIDIKEDVCKLSLAIAKRVLSHVDVGEYTTAIKSFLSDIACDDFKKDVIIVRINPKHIDDIQSYLLQHKPYIQISSDEDLEIGDCIVGIDKSHIRYIISERISRVEKLFMNKIEEEVCE